MDLAKVEGDEIVIRVPITALPDAAEHSGLAVTDAEALAPCFARELNAEGTDEDLFLNKVMDAALVRCVENDDPGIAIIEGEF